MSSIIGSIFGGLVGGFVGSLIYYFSARRSSIESNAQQLKEDTAGVYKEALAHLNHTGDVWQNWRIQMQCAGQASEETRDRANDAICRPDIDAALQLYASDEVLRTWQMAVHEAAEPRENKLSKEWRSKVNQVAVVMRNHLQSIAPANKQQLQINPQMLACKEAESKNNDEPSTASSQQPNAIN